MALFFAPYYGGRQGSQSRRHDPFYGSLFDDQDLFLSPFELFTRDGHQQRSHQRQNERKREGRDDGGQSGMQLSIGNNRDDWANLMSPNFSTKQTDYGTELSVKLPPDFNVDNCNVHLDGNSLCISGEYKFEDTKEGCHTKRYSSFKRSFPVPADVEPSQLKAHFDDGTLTVQIHSNQLKQPSRIAITSSKGSSNTATSGKASPDIASSNKGAANSGASGKTLEAGSGKASESSAEEVPANN